MEIYITLCIGDWSTGTSDFIEAAGGADTDTGTECFCVSKRSFFFPQPRSSVILLPRFEKNSITTKSPRSLRATDKKHRKKKKKNRIFHPQTFSERSERIQNVRTNRKYIFNFSKFIKLNQAGLDSFIFFFPPSFLPRNVDSGKSADTKFRLVELVQEKRVAWFRPIYSEGKVGQIECRGEARRGGDH